MTKPKLPKEFIKKCKSVTAKRAKTVIDHIIEHDFITTEELKQKYGYDHPPRAARDVREQGIPLDTFRIENSDGKKIGAYRFGDPRKMRFSKLTGRTAFSKKLKNKLVENQGSRCAIYLEVMPESELQIDHRIPFEVAGDDPQHNDDPDDYMLLSGSANRAKSWSCEHCANWLDSKDKSICSTCYWAYPDSYKHIAMRQIRRLDIIWSENEIDIFERLKKKTLELHVLIPEYVKEIIKKHI